MYNFPCMYIYMGILDNIICLRILFFFLFFYFFLLASIAQLYSTGNFETIVLYYTYKICVFVLCCVSVSVSVCFFNIN